MMELQNTTTILSPSFWSKLGRTQRRNETVYKISNLLRDSTNLLQDSGNLLRDSVNLLRDSANLLRNSVNQL